MARIRIRWGSLGKVAALAVAALLALQVLPGLLKAPEPPPLAADVGLPRVEVRSRSEPKPPRAPRHHRPAPRSPLPREVISSTPRRHAARPAAAKPAEPAKPRVVATPPSAPAPEPAAAPIEPVPVPAPEPSPAPVPTPAPAANDGSVEFAPH